MLISEEQIHQIKSRLLSGEKEIYCSGLFLSARWFVLGSVAEKGCHTVILPNKESAEYCASDLYDILEGDKVFFLPESGKKVERSNYKSSLGVQRTSAIEKIFSFKDSETLVVVTYPEALDELIPSKGVMERAVIHLNKGDEISYEEIINKLSSSDFEKVDFVSAPGQYAIRGSIVDVFSFSNNNPYRLSFWGNEIEKINEFNADTQLSVIELDSVKIVSDIVSNEDYSGKIGIMSCLPEQTVVWLDSSDLYKDKQFYTDVFRYRKVFIDSPVSSEIEERVKFNILPQPIFNKNFELFASDIRIKQETGYRVYIYGEKESQLERLKSILSQENCGVLPFFIRGKNIHSGFIDNNSKTCHYSDHEIFDRFHRVQIRRSVDRTEQLTINDLNSFNIGDYVVHIDHGIGVFGGLVRVFDEMGRPKEVVKITYRDGDVVFVSVNSLHKISLFRSGDGVPPTINKLGSKTWITLKNKTKSRVKDIAKDLIRLYAKRKASKGYAFSPDSYLQDELESSFIYEDTPDQEAATKAVKHDMEDNCPMDRLVCGDVGFGKTEIAIRAAFKAVCDSRQVAVLVPTTILALQHFNTFTNRLKGLPCNVDYVSRLRTAKELSDIKERLRKGSIDIIIGTHKILSKEFEFKELGLLIIDEEQKFGVAAKEKLREVREGIDTLTLTATPIPRTLQFSLLSARDLSIINTAPPNRIPVTTEIILFDKTNIKGIIDYELNRGGQIFFLHNKVEELPAIEEILHRLVPDMKICVAHGQMESKELENKMLDFIRGDYDLLLCTTIIENGLDIPNANTIIINQAQNIGLSDLHQLRGRVGRSNKRAFCYLIVPPLVSITEDARRRLKAIEEFSDLGSGFNIAMQDLDIRGAGNLLGAEQSGFITDMGYETYQKILSEAMEELGMETGEMVKQEGGKVIQECTVETDKPALIPESYLDISSEKIRIYKRLDAMTSDKEIDNYRRQIEDRFGKFPIEVENLFYVLKIRNFGERNGFEKIIIKNGMLICFFISNQMSPYFKTEKFGSILGKITENSGLFALKQTEGKLKTVTRGVENLEKACQILNKLQ